MGPREALLGARIFHRKVPDSHSLPSQSSTSFHRSRLNSNHGYKQNDIDKQIDALFRVVHLNRI